VAEALLFIQVCGVQGLHPTQPAARKGSAHSEQQGLPFVRDLFGTLRRWGGGAGADWAVQGQSQGGGVLGESALGKRGRGIVQGYVD